jgi:hypothetical protein
MIIRILVAKSYKSDLHGFYPYTQFLNMIVEALHNPQVLGLNIGPRSTYFEVFHASRWSTDLSKSVLVYYLKTCHAHFLLNPTHSVFIIMLPLEIKIMHLQEHY